MLARPKLQFYIGKIKENGRKMKTICESHDLTPLFVTKGFCAAPEIIGAMREIGITHFGDSRLMNIMKAKESFPDLHYLLIRTPSPFEAEETAKYADASIESSAVTVKAISKEAVKLKKMHEVYVNIDVGDLRDGLFGKEELDDFMKQTAGLPGIIFKGVFANVGCYGSILPDEKNTQKLVDIKNYINESYGLNIDTVSFGGTVALPMIMDGKMPKGVNQLRFGEAALFGEDTSGNHMLEGFFQDAVLFSAPVLEVLVKPSVPMGTKGRDACGRVNEYEDRGVHERIILGAGKQDIEISALTPVDKGMIILGRSSDHMIIDAGGCSNLPQVGDYAVFRCGYMAMLAAATSPYVEKEYLK